MDEAVEIATKASAAKERTSIAYHGNIVDLLEYIADNKVKMDMVPFAGCV